MDKRIGIIELKVKIKSLAAEAAIIRLEERRALGRKNRIDGLYFSLNRHRRFLLRYEARSSQLAYAFLRGRPYRTTESSVLKTPMWPDVKRIAAKFSNMSSSSPELAKELDDWAKAPVPALVKTIE